MSIVKETETQMSAAIEHLKEELKGIRTGQANPGMVENIQAEVYGSPMRIRDVAQISTPESRQLLITPFDPSTAASISKGIEQANLGFRATIDGGAIRILIPPMDKQLRDEMVKLCGRYSEEAKVRVRNARRHGNDSIKKDKNIPEDEQKKMEKEIQDLTDKFCKLADEVSLKKEKEVASI